MKGVVQVMSEWREIIKAKGKLSSVPTMRTNLKKVPTKPKKTDCNSRLKAYGEFLKNRKGIISELNLGKDLKPTAYKKFGPTREVMDDDDPNVNEKYTIIIIYDYII